ncbi:MAG: rRNA maturation RNase YbeY [Ectothiorhodospiraceae bacterium]|nr:rRNA maturation RNase YbeY [Chromatiales bacterium]MCP5156749.1 rRNA maturation RNase YbeY [Ectothiorhodospiraceae bacterium]
MAVQVQLACRVPGRPAARELARFARAALAEVPRGMEMTVRVVDEVEGAELNETYRRKSGPTNVLAFPFEAPPGASVRLLGDVVICAPVVAREAEEQGKEPRAHWAHMVVHGTLHLLGYDHRRAAQAARMESREREILTTLGFPDPYAESQSREDRP